MALPFSQMAPEMPPAMPEQGAATGIMALIDSLVTPDPEPVYAPGYKPPKKPEVGEILKRAELAKAANQPFLDLAADTYNYLRFQTAGYLTDKDLEARRQQTQVPYISPRAYADWNRFVAYLSARPRAFSVEVYDPTLEQYAQNIEDFCYHLRRYHERAWVRSGNIALPQAESKDLTFFGTIVSRRTCDLTNPKCPIRAVLIDPTTIFPQYGRVGNSVALEAVYRIYKTTAAQAVAEWVTEDPIPKDIRDGLGDQLHAFGQDAEIDVVEYYDSWWCGAFVMGTDIALKKLTAHEYGCVPYIIQYGPGGEPMHTRNPGQGFNPLADRWGGGGFNDERIYKATGFIQQMKRPQAFIEGLTTRYLQNVITGFNPPMVIERTMDAAERMPMPTIDRSEGAINELAAGEERIAELPTGQSAKQDASFLMQILSSDANAVYLPDSFQGLPDKSNISGTAQRHAAEEGREMEDMWIEAMELFHGECLTHDVKLYRNHGYLASYAGGSKKSYYIPRRNPQETQEKAFELTPEMIDAVDTEVSCSMQSLRLSELMPFAQTMQLLGPTSQTPIYTIRDIARMAGKTDIERTIQENRTYRTVEKALELPELLKGVEIPMALQLAVKQAEGNPDLQAELMEYFLWWKENIAGPQQQQMDMQNQQAAMGPQGGPQGPPQGGSPQPGQGIPGGAGAPYAEMGMGPGSQGAPVGRPPDAGAGPPPPPPGSFRIEP